MMAKFRLPRLDRTRYTDLSDQGLEGPFMFKGGEVLYYDPKKGQYYNRDSDMYLSNEEADRITSAYRRASFDWIYAPQKGNHRAILKMLQKKLRSDGWVYDKSKTSELHEWSWSKGENYRNSVVISISGHVKPHKFLNVLVKDLNGTSEVWSAKSYETAEEVAEIVLEEAQKLDRLLNTTRRSASEIIRNLEMRVARLEKSAGLSSSKRRLGPKKRKEARDFLELELENRLLEAGKTSRTIQVALDTLRNQVLYMRQPTVPYDVFQYFNTEKELYDWFTGRGELKNMINIKSTHSPRLLKELRDFPTLINFYIENWT